MHATTVNGKTHIGYVSVYKDGNALWQLDSINSNSLPRHGSQSPFPFHSFVRNLGSTREKNGIDYHRGPIIECLRSAPPSLPGLRGPEFQKYATGFRILTSLWPLFRTTRRSPACNIKQLQNLHTIPNPVPNFDGDIVRVCTLGGDFLGSPPVFLALSPAFTNVTNVI